ncbi:MAG: DUF2911 domain-containing protein [Acidobacteria bacterium]|nr:DUF2911 domain-containing protein [Acidobacteriota bacterium]MCL5287149.1 DUF2911 domain-containing protein [Acidobacteriota bacterium]
MVRRLLALIVLVFGCTYLAPAQKAEAASARSARDLAEVQIRMAELLRYTGVENASPADVARMAELWSTAQDSGAASEQRQTALADLQVLYAKLHGQELPAAAKQSFARFAAPIFEAGGQMDLRLPDPRGKPAGNYLHVETHGSGPTVLLLISDMGVDGRKLYDSFVRRNAKAYTMHIVTLPFAGAARPLPWPEKLDYTARPWLNQIERELLALLDQPRMKGVVVVGTAAGGYFATRAALLRPKQVRAAVLVDALVNMPMRARNAPDAPVPLAERLARVGAVAPMPQLFPYVSVPAAEQLRKLIADPNSTHPTARNWMAFAVKDRSLSEAWTYEALSTGFFVTGREYQWELFTTDLTEEMRHLSVPMLAMGAIHDAGSPRQSPPSLSQWDEIKLRNPEVPLTVVAFEDSRSYISEEYPAEFDRALADFLAGRAVHGKAGYSLPRPSPRASVMQAVGGAEVHIAYSRPAVKGRKVWGELVPYNRVWRAGANEATTITFSRDVRLEGHALAAGTYTFFVIPAENEWTLIFNRVPRQWGAFNYNPEFDALRVAVPSAEGQHEELVRYAIEPTDANRARVSLAWERRRIEFSIEVSPQ